MEIAIYRQNYKPKVPKILSDIKLLTAVDEKVIPIEEEIKNIFPNTYNQPIKKFIFSKNSFVNPLKIGVFFSGGQASGGHNVITGLYDAIKSIDPASQLIGFLNGPLGLLKGDYKELTEELIHKYRNQGGFDLLGSGRTKIEKEEQFKQALNCCKDLKLDGLVVVGGDDSNSNAAYLSEFFLKNGLKTSVIGVPKTIDGDLKNEFIEISFGFDTATKVYAEIISNIARDAISAKKYYFFIKMMGRSASHVTLECALQVHPNLALISEEILKEKKRIHTIIKEIADLICERANQGKNYGVILIPEGLIEFIPDFINLIHELNQLENTEISPETLSKESFECYNLLSKEIQNQLLQERDPHGNIQVSKIETERLLISLVEKELLSRKESNQYSGQFSAQPLFLGYEGRSCFPSNFDAQYCYALGHVAVLLIKEKLTAYMCCLKNLSHQVSDWIPLGIPLVGMIHREERKGKILAVIKKNLVDLEGIVFKKFIKERKFWKIEDDYQYRGPIQFYAPEELVESIPLTLKLESSK